jgi:RND superfamily putative drug exporter
MLDRIAALTWQRPKLVLAVLGTFVAVAIAFGANVEHHLKAAGFTDPSSESEQGSDLLSNALGYDPNPGVVLVVRAPGGGPLNLKSAPLRRQVDQLSGKVAKVKYIGRVVNPLQDPRAGAQLIARDGRSLVILGDLANGDEENDGGIAAEGVEPLIAASRLNVSMGGFAPSFNEVNDQTKTDLTKAELIAFPLLALLLLIVFRGVVAAAIPLLIGVVSIVGTLFVLRIMSELVDTSVFALNIATGLSLGLAVDYALLMVSRYREEMAAPRVRRTARPC